MVDVFDQVEEELRSERYKRLARVGLPILGGILALALVLALAWWGWDSWQNSKADKASEAYDRGMEALQANNAAGAKSAFEEAAKEGNGAYRSLALQQQAGLAMTAERPQDALRLFDEAIKADGEPILADAAALKAAWIVMDTGALADIEKRLEPLTAEGRPYRPFAQHALAMARLQHGKTAEARELLVQIQLGQNVPDDLRQQAQAAIGMIDNGTVGALAPIIRAQAALPPPPATPAPTASATVGAAPAQAPAQ